jgi:hypothetical protein
MKMADYIGKSNISDLTMGEVVANAHALFHNGNFRMYDIGGKPRGCYIAVKDITIETAKSGGSRGIVPFSNCVNYLDDLLLRANRVDSDLESMGIHLEVPYQWIGRLITEALPMRGNENPSAELHAGIAIDVERQGSCKYKMTIEVCAGGQDSIKNTRLKSDVRKALVGLAEDISKELRHTLPYKPKMPAKK